MESATSPLSSSRVGDTGVISPRYLNTQEKVLYESRPSWISVVSFKLLVWDVVISIIMFSAAAAVPAGAGVLLLLWFFIGPIQTVLRTLRWRNEFYGLTDQRILRGSGLTGSSLKSITVKRTTGLMDVNTARVTAVEMHVNTAGKIFGYGTILFRTNVANMEWTGVKHVYDARRYVEETLNQFQDVAGTELTYRDQITRTVAKIATEQKLGFLPQQAPYATPGSPATTQTMSAVPNAALLQPPSTVQCSKCALAYPSGTKFCSNCGSPLETRGVPVPA